MYLVIDVVMQSIMENVRYENPDFDIKREYHYNSTLYLKINM